MDEFLTQLATVFIQYATELILIIITALIGKVLSWSRTLIENLLKESAVDEAVHYVEQMYRGVSSSEKYNEALRIASSKLNQNRIKIGQDELKILIESAVNKYFPKIVTVNYDEIY